MPNAAYRRTWLISAILFAAVAGCNRGDTSPGNVTASVSGDPVATDAPRSRPAPLEENKHPVVRIETTAGTLTVELDGELAPITVKNFLWYVNNGHYQQTIFHQVIPKYVAIAGGYSIDGTEKPTHIAIRNEADNGLKNLRGTIAMARRPDDIDSSTSQFFFNLADNSNLDQQSHTTAAEYGYCVFGKIIDGDEVLDRISAVEVAKHEKFGSTPATPLVIKSVTRIR